MQKKPTEKQVKYLESLGLNVPTSRVVAHHIISWVTKGNGSSKESKDSFGRASYLKITQDKYEGKRVVCEINGPGVVRQIIPRTREKVAFVRELNAEVHGSSIVAAFDATIKLDNGKVKVVALSFLKLLE